MTSQPSSPVPANELDRLRALQRFDVLDTPAEKEFDDIALIASYVTKCPTALISLIDERRQWFKARIGCSVSETPRDLAFCAHAIMQQEIMQVPDARKDPRFAQHPLVIAEPGLRFYAGAPLVTRDNYVLGTLCVIDNEPKELDEQQVAVMKALSRQVIAQLELRQALVDRRRAEAAMTRLASIVQSSDDAIIGKTLEGGITDWNAGAERLFGFTEKEAVGNTVALLVPPELDAEERRILAAVSQGNRIDHYATQRRAKDGRIIDVSLSVSPIRQDGKIVGASSIARDISREKEAEWKLQEARRLAEEANKAKSDFLANMSHEIRTPLNGVIGLADLISGTELNAQQKQYLEMLQTSADALLNVINDILDFSKIESGKLELEEAPFNLPDKIGDLVKTLAATAARKGLEVALDISKDVPECVVGDFARLNQILLNLIGNAVKFTSKGEIVLRLARGETKADRFCLKCSVRDTGIGIPADKQGRLFEAFSQADTSITRRYGGTGLGLAICARLVNLMGGSICVQSAEGQGSEFTFTVWLKLDNEQPSPNQSPSAGIEGKRALVVDDNSTNRIIMADLLQRHGLETVTAAAPADALELFSKPNPPSFDIVALDYQMPEMDGLHLARNLRDILGPQIPIIILSSCAVVGVPRGLIFRTLTKPVKERELMSVVLEAFGRSAAALPHGTLASRVASQQRKLNILLAEDSVINQQVAVGLLRRQGHFMTVVENGQQAVEAVQKTTFDLVLMDVQMPIMDGFEATRQIRALELKTGRHVPILAMTALAIKGDRERCLEAGMDDYVTKPIKSAQLFEAIQKLTTPPPSAEPPVTSDFNLEAFLEITDNDADLIRDLVALFREQTPRTLTDLREALAAGDRQRIKFAAHKAKGELGNFQAHRGAGLAGWIENSAEEGDLAQLTAAVAPLEREITLLDARLQELLDERAAS